MFLKIEILVTYPESLGSRLGLWNRNSRAGRSMERADTIESIFGDTF
jgi:hypothetical protein